MRLISAMRATDNIMSGISDGICQLNMGAQWLYVMIRVGELAVLCGVGQITGFYLYGLDACWRVLFGVSRPVRGTHFGLELDVVYFLAVKVRPRGWLSSVGCLQHMHRRALLASGWLPSFVEGRKDRPLPLSFATGHRRWWTVYLDDRSTVLVRCWVVGVGGEDTGGELQLCVGK